MKLSTAICTLCGIGKIPFAPGTFGTLATVPFAAVALWYLPFEAYLVFALVFAGFSVWACHLYEKEALKHDASEVVIDESAGLIVAFAGLPYDWRYMLAAFCLFRFFDIVKPPPIGLIDRRVRGGFGVVADDLVAGVFAGAVIHFIAPWISVFADVGEFF